MAENTSSDIMIQIGTQLDDKGLKDLNAQLAKTGMVAAKNADTGKLAFQKMGDGAGKAGDNIAKAALKLTAWYMAAQKAITGAVDKAKADKQLEMAVKNNTDAISRQGKSVNELTKEFIDYADAREKSANIDDAATESLQRMILAAGEAPQNVNRVVEAFQDLEAASGISAESMSRAWARMAEDPSEALGALSKAGVMIDKQSLEGLNAIQQKAVILDQIEKKYKGQALSAAEATGSVGRFGVAMDNLFESIGKIVITVITPFLDGLGKIANLFAEMPGWLQAAVLGIGGLATAVYMAGGSFTALGAAVKGFFVSLGPIGWAIAGVTALVGVLGLIGKETDYVAESTQHMNEAMKLASQSNALEKKLKASTSALEGLKEGTDDYKTAVQKMLNQNPALVNMGITTASTFDQIKDAASRAVTQVNNLTDAERLLALEAAKTAMNRSRIQAMGMLGSNATERLQGAVSYGSADFLAAQASGGLKGSRYDIERAMEARIRAALPGMSDDLIHAAQAKFRKLLEGYAAESTIAPTTTAPAGGGGGGATPEKQTYDLAALRISLIKDEFTRRRAEQAKYYQEELVKIKASSLSEADQKTAINLMVKKNIEANADIDREEQKKTLEALGNGLAASFDVGTSIINGDWKAAITTTLSSISPVLGGVFSGAVSFFGALFKDGSKDATDYLREHVSKAVDITADVKKWSDLINSVLGETAQESIDVRKRGALQALAELNAAIKDQTSYKLNIDFSGKTAEQMLDVKEIMSGFDPKSLEGTGFAGEAIKRKYYDQLMAAGLSYQEAWSLINMSMVSGAESAMSVIDGIIENVKVLGDIRIEDSLNDYKKQLLDIDHLVKTGKLTEEQADAKRVSVYDNMIASLKGVEGAEEALKKLEEERYAILKGQSKEMETQAMTEQQRALASKAAALADDIKYGRKANDYTNNAQLQSYYTELLTSMKASGLFGTAVYKEVEDQLMALVKSNIGEGGYAAASGTGSNAVFGSTIPTRNQYNPVIQVDGRNTNSSQVIINAPLNMPPDIVPWFLRIAQTQSGRGL